MKTKTLFLEEISQYKQYDTELIGRAYDKAKALHEGQLRKSGEPYLIHPIAVAIILAQLGMKGVVFSGDTLFRQSVGRTDFYGGDFNQLMTSIRERLFVLPDDTVVLPGHMEDTTIKFEKENNPFVR